MSYYEYRVVEAPAGLPRTKGVKGTGPRYALGLEQALNDEGRDGWEFQRTERMSVSVRKGIFRKESTETVTLLVYRRWVEEASAPRFDPLPDRRAEPPYDEPETPEELGARLAPQGDASDRTSPTRPHSRLSAQRTPEGNLPPLRGPARD